MFGVIHFVEWMGEGLVGFLVLLIIPAAIMFLDHKTNPEKKNDLSIALENHFLDRVIHLARGGKE